MELDNVLKIINAVSSSDINSFSYEDGAVKLSLRKDACVGDKEDNICKTDSISKADNTYKTDSISRADNTYKSEGVEACCSTDDDEVNASEGDVVKSPLVGIFYSAASPEDEPFVKVGDTVKKGQVLGIVEAMKLMNEIESEADGVVKQILVANEQMVEYGQPMFIISGN